MDSEVTKVSGRMDFFLGLRFQRHLCRLVLGAWRFSWIGPSLVIVVLTATLIETGALSSDDDLITAASLASCLIAIVACILVFSRSATRKLRQGWSARGVPDEVELSFVVAADGLHISSETGKTVVHWPYVSEIDLADDCWLVIGAAWALPLPRRFFATPAEERAFLSRVLERMSPAARKRSSKAANFVSTG